MLAERVELNIQNPPREAVSARPFIVHSKEFCDIYEARRVHVARMVEIKSARIECLKSSGAYAKEAERDMHTYIRKHADLLECKLNPSQ